jgi:mono/diheme cytochrome c family protein
MRFGSLIVALLMITACHRAAPAPVAATRPRPSLYEMEIGKQTFQTYCAGCHGETGAGDGFNSFSLDPHPRDLGDPTFQKTKSNADLQDAIRRGGAGVGLSALMPPWGRTLDARHVDATVLYIRSLRRGPPR